MIHDATNVSTQGVEPGLERRDAIPAIIGRHEDFLLVTGLGNPAREIAALTNDTDSMYALGGAMGAATMMGLGLALAQPSRRVLVVTGDGELLMNVSSLCTVGVIDPPNLSILCVDNGHYGETGYQKSHTSRGADLEAIARGSNISQTLTVNTEDDYAAARRLIRSNEGCSFVLLRVAPTDGARRPRDLDPAACRRRFRGALQGSGAR